MKKINIAIDGPSAAGKSTIAKILADKLDYIHLDTGAMYRCAALLAVRNKESLDQEEAIVPLLRNAEISFDTRNNVYLNGENVTKAIREEEISLAASKVSKLKNVRRELVARQQKIASARGFILDGRDIGTVVLPDAEVKIFLTADPMARAKRRYLQDQQEGISTKSVEELAKEIEQRDYEDTHRKESPLRQAEDAVAVDTSNKTIDEVVEILYGIVKDKLQEVSCKEE